MQTPFSSQNKEKINTPQNFVIYTKFKKFKKKKKTKSKFIQKDKIEYTYLVQQNELCRQGNLHQTESNPVYKNYSKL